MAEFETGWRLMMRRVAKRLSRFDQTSSLVSTRAGCAEGVPAPSPPVSLESQSCQSKHQNACAAGFLVSTSNVALILFLRFR